MILLVRLYIIVSFFEKRIIDLFKLWVYIYIERNDILIIVVYLLKSFYKRFFLGK